MGCLPSDDSGSNPSNNVKQPLLRNEDKEAKKRRAQKRLSAVTELLETERTYVSGLDLCIKEYYNGLSEDGKIVSSDDLRGIFNDIQTIFKLNQTFLQDLTMRISDNFNNDKTLIGDQFIKFCPYFRMYQNYCNNYDNAMVLLQKYNTKQPFITFANSAKERTNNKTLQSLLILPIQRLPRYKMCLSEIIKNTEENHPDLVDLQRAFELVDETTTLINERMKEFESRQLVRSIEQRFVSSIKLVKPHRRFIKEGLLTKVHKTGKDKTYIFFLFNDILLYSSEKKNDKLKLHIILPIDRAFFVQDVPHHNKYSDRAFEIHSSIKSFIVHTKEYKIKKQWMEEIRKVIQDRVRKQLNKTQERELAAPLMVPDDWSDECMLKDCSTKFSVIKRRHHCRYCGKLMCSKCGKYKLASRMNKDRVVKPVCKVCYNSYNGIYAAKENAKEEVEADGGSDDSDVDYKSNK